MGLSLTFLENDRRSDAVESARITAAAVRAASEATARATEIASETSAGVAEASSQRSTILAVLAGTLAGLTILLNALTYRATLKQHRDDLAERDASRTADLEDRESARRQEQVRADRLHVTQLFDNAAGQLGHADDAVRTAGVFVLERLFDDARLLPEKDESSGPQGPAAQAMRRSIVETLCGYVRERSRNDFLAHEGSLPSSDLRAAYKSPASVRAAVLVLGRIETVPQDVLYDLSGSHLAAVRFAGNYERDLEMRNTVLGEDVIFREGTVFRAVDWSYADFRGSVSFDRVSFREGTSFFLAEFQEQASFSHAAFGDHTWFGSVRFHDDALFWWTKFGSRVDFGESQFRGQADFDGSTFGPESSFDDVRFVGQTTFKDAAFQEGATFSGATYPGDVPPWSLENRSE